MIFNPSMQTTGKSDDGQGGLVLPLWLVWLCAVVFIGYGLGSYAVLDNNEGLYAEISREMLHSGRWQDWVIPHLNGLVYMEKPPLLYWLTAVFFAIFGEHEWVVRLAPALSAVACVALLLWFSARIAQIAAGRLAAIMFVSSLGVMVMARTLMFDMLLTALLTAALMGAYLFVSEGKAQALRWSLAMLAGAILAKGLVALVLYCAVLGAYLIWQADSVADFFRRLLIWFEPKAWLIFVAIVAPWHIAATLVEPVFGWFYFVNEHVLRFLGKREPHDYYSGSWWYYLPRMLVFLFPWAFLLPVMAWRKAEHPVRACEGQKFLLLAWLMPFLFFSLSSAKANYYLVAVMPLLSLQLALWLTARGLTAGFVAAVPGLLMATAFSFVASQLARADLDWLSGLTIHGYGAAEFIGLCLAGIAIAAVLAAVLCWRMKSLGIVAYVLPAWMCLWMFLQIIGASEEWTSSRPVARFLQQQEPQREVVLYQVFESRSSLSFYLQQPLKVLESRSADLYWGNRLYRNDVLWSGTQFRELLGSRKIVLLVRQQDIADFKSKSYASALAQTKTIGALTLFVN